MGDENEVMVDGTEQKELTDAGSVEITEQQKEEIRKKYDALVTGIDESYDAQVEAVEEAYGKQIGGMQDFIDTAVKEKGKIAELDEEQQKRARAFRYIAGVGDALSGIANLVGTAHGAVNQQQHYNAPALIQKAEALRKERKLEMDKVNARLDELSAQKTALESGKVLKLGELAGKRASEKATADLQKIKGETDIITTNAKEAGNLAKTAMNNATKLEVARINAGKPSSTTSRKTPKLVPIQMGDGTIKQLDVAAYKDFEGDYQRALDRAVAQGISGMTAEEIEQYNLAKVSANAGEAAALRAFLNAHTYREEVVNLMNSSPIFNSLP